MHLAERFVATITYVISFFSFSGDVGEHTSKHQTPLLHNSVQLGHGQVSDGPVFKPPTGRPPYLPGGDLVCDYTAMGPDWQPCSSAENRQCWLRNSKTGKEFNITIDYEDPENLPKGIDRYYTLNLEDGWINADGLNFTEAKFFWNVSDPESWDPDRRYPGPWVQACWGDKVHINVVNNLRFNGTSVHWHGIRQLNTSEMDGVPGITQCPIAPRDNFTYSWTARQYGSSWYHSHYSLQYADGALGPMTIHGPTSADWDEPRFPIMMTDWGHNSAFDAIWNGLDHQSTLLNGKGDVTRYNNAYKNNLPIPQPHNITVSSASPGNRAKRYLLRLINTSFESNFIFTIDKHIFTVISTDFVAIHPYNTSSVTIGIGQRYNVVLIADRGNTSSSSFWMRAYRPKCFHANDNPSKNYELAGIVFYDDETNPPDPNAIGWPIDTSPAACSDEPYGNLHPVVNWTVGDFTNQESHLAVQIHKGGVPDPTIFPLAMFSIGGENFNPLQIDYYNPIFLNMDSHGEWNPRWVVYPENYTASDWVYLVLKGVSGRTEAHPIHLHGHDFAILEQVSGRPYDPNKVNLNLNNPPRRDVVMLPTNGYVVIAFRTDNPGPWIMHCHIAQHASFGLALQIMERQSTAFSIASHNGAITQAQQTCMKWEAWWRNCNNWWYSTSPGQFCNGGEDAFSPDSGI